MKRQRDGQRGERQRPLGTRPRFTGPASGFRRLANGANSAAHLSGEGLAGLAAGGSNRGWFLGLVLVVATVVAYQPAWRGGFVWDDDLHIRNNRMLVEPGGLKQIWSSPDSPQYYPLVFTSFRLERGLWGLEPAGYHWANLLLHAASAVWVWRVLRRLQVPGAWLAAAMFALHPVNVESVAWISQRKNTLAMFFYLLSLLLYLRFDQESKVQCLKSKVSSQESGGTSQNRPSRSTSHASRFPFHASRITFHASRFTFHALFPLPSSLFYSLSLFAFVLALLSKTAVAPFPVVLLGLAWWRRGRVTGRDVRRSAPFFTASLVLGLMTVWFERHQTAQQIVRDDSFWSRLAGAGWAVWFYLYKAVAPLNLMFVYPRWQIDPSKALAYLPGVVVVGALLLLWRYRRRWGRAWLFCAGYYLVMLLPVLGFVNIGFMRYSLVADHWQYFAILGPIALIAAALTAAWVRWGRANQALGVGLGGALLLLLGVLTWKQARIYADEETLWRDTLAKNPACWLAHNNLGSALDIKGQFDAALPQFREALRLNPDYALAHYNLGTALVRQGGVAEAISHFQKALQINPGDPKTQNNLAWVLATGADASLRNGNEAVALARQANEFAGGKDPLFLGTLAAALAEAGRFSDAARTARKGIELARAAGQPGLAARLSGELKRYEGRLPLHQ